jgi:hypothetical protein
MLEVAAGDATSTDLDEGLAGLKHELGVDITVNEIEHDVL